MLPHVGIAGGTPRPRKLRLASAMMAVAMAKVPITIAFQAQVLKQHIDVLPRDTEQAILPREVYLVESITSELRLVDIYALAAQRSRRGTRTDLDNLLRKMQGEFLELSDILARQYFSHAMTVRSGVSAAGSL